MRSQESLPLPLQPPHQQQLQRPSVHTCIPNIIILSNRSLSLTVADTMSGHKLRHPVPDTLNMIDNMDNAPMDSKETAKEPAQVNQTMSFVNQTNTFYATFNGLNTTILINMTDIDECLQYHPCERNQRCINTNGSYKCQNLLTCSGGYTSNNDGTQCIGTHLSLSSRLNFLP